jgi:hypothetical protein
MLEMTLRLACCAAAAENVKFVGLGLHHDDDPIKAGNLGDWIFQLKKLNAGNCEGFGDILLCPNGKHRNNAYLISILLSFDS